MATECSVIVHNSHEKKKKYRKVFEGVKERGNLPALFVKENGVTRQTEETFCDLKKHESINKPKSVI